MGKLKIGIVGYGNLGKGAEKALAQNPDMELVAVFTRRQPEQLAAGGVSSNTSPQRSSIKGL